MYFHLHSSTDVFFLSQAITGHSQADPAQLPATFSDTSSYCMTGNLEIIPTLMIIITEKALEGNLTVTAFHLTL